MSEEIKLNWREVVQFLWASLAIIAVVVMLCYFIFPLTGPTPVLSGVNSDAYIYDPYINAGQLSPTPWICWSKDAPVPGYMENPSSLPRCRQIVIRVADDLTVFPSDWKLAFGGNLVWKGRIILEIDPDCTVWPHIYASEDDLQNENGLNLTEPEARTIRYACQTWRIWQQKQVLPKLEAAAGHEDY